MSTCYFAFSVNKGHRNPIILSLNRKFYECFKNGTHLSQSTAFMLDLKLAIYVTIKT